MLRLHTIPFGSWNTKENLKKEQLSVQYSRTFNKNFLKQALYSKTSIPYLLEERLCSKEHLPIISIPFLTWNISWVAPSNECPSFLSKKTLTWKRVFIGGTHLGITKKNAIIQLIHVSFVNNGVLHTILNMRHFIILLLLPFLLFDLRDKLKVFWWFFDIFNECLPRKSAPLNKRLPLRTQNYMSTPGAHSSKYGIQQLWKRTYQ